MVDRNKKGRAARGMDTTHNAKLTRAQVDEILKILPRKNQLDIAKLFGVSQPTISRIANRKSNNYL